MSENEKRRLMMASRDVWQTLKAEDVAEDDIRRNILVLATELRHLRLSVQGEKGAVV